MDKPADPSDMPDHRLAVYGSLAPGKLNHQQISQLSGTWRRGTVNGRLLNAGWGAAIGFPGLVLDPLAPPVDVQLFESKDLPQHWERLDQFEGNGYRRSITTVTTAQGKCTAWVYVIAEAQA